MSVDVEDATTTSRSRTATQVCVSRQRGRVRRPLRQARRRLSRDAGSKLPGGHRRTFCLDVRAGPRRSSRVTSVLNRRRHFAEGKFDDRNQAIELTHGRVKEETLVTSTRVRAEINGVTVGTEKRLTVGRMVAELRSTSPKGGRGEPSIPVGEVSIAGLAIDGFRMRIALNSKPFIDHDTHAKVLRGIIKPAFAKQSAVSSSSAAGALLPHRRPDSRDAGHESRVGERAESEGRDRRQSIGRRQGLRQHFLWRDPDQRGLPPCHADAP